jgi:methionine-rich copper-binding protein CopC
MDVYCWRPMMQRTVAPFALVLALVLTTPAFAHAHLTGADPGADATVTLPTQLVLHFSEKLDPKFSGLSVTMPKMNNMKMPVKVVVSPDGLSLVATPTEHLAAGVYTVSWHAVTADTHRTQGTYSFTVR